MSDDLVEYVLEHVAADLVGKPITDGAGNKIGEIQGALMENGWVKCRGVIATDRVGDEPIRIHFEVAAGRAKDS